MTPIPSGIPRVYLWLTRWCDRFRPGEQLHPGLQCGESLELCLVLPIQLLLCARGWSTPGEGGLTVPVRGWLLSCNTFFVPIQLLCARGWSTPGEGGLTVPARGWLPSCNTLFVAIPDIARRVSSYCHVVQFGSGRLHCSWRGCAFGYPLSESRPVGVNHRMT